MYTILFTKGKMSKFKCRWLLLLFILESINQGHKGRVYGV